MANLGQLGAGQLGYQQAGLDIGAQADEMKRQEPYQRLGWYGGQLSQLMGGMPNPYMQTSPQAAAPSPFMQHWQQAQVLMVWEVFLKIFGDKVNG